MSVSDHTCPACWRYGRQEMREIWLESYKLQKNLDVEAALSMTQAELDVIPEYAAREIAKKANIEYVTPEFVWELEQKIKHDLMAMVLGLTEACDGDAGNYVHQDATSYDIEDNRLSSQIRDASEIIISDTRGFAKALMERAEEYKSLPAIGRTHGQWAEPITFGFKYANILADAMMDYITWTDFSNKFLVGKPMTGAVGTSDSYVHTCGQEKAIKIGEGVLKKLGLKPALITTQIISRKMHAKALEALAQSAMTSAKFAWEVWNLQRPEIGEVWEKKYHPKIKGSSAMPHKRNPVNCENMVSLSRVVKVLSQVGYDNIPLLHERDITNSGAERIVIPQSFIYTDEILKRAESTAKDMIVREENVRKNLESAKKFTITEPVMLSITGETLGRQEAHNILVKYSDYMYDHMGDDPIEVLHGIPEIGERMEKSKIEKMFKEHGGYTGLSQKYTEDVISAANELFVFD
ncbi:adenylosuccinate lyase [Candidatus Aenigmatarchaeota archaeon]